MSKVIHYANYEPATESDPQDYWSETACGHEYENCVDDWDSVTCHNCLRKKQAHLKEVIEFP